VDVEVITLGLTYLTELGLDDTELHLNSVGCPACRPRHREELVAFLSGKLDCLCRDCQNRYEVNPLRVLDCKEERCQAETKDAPVMVNFLCDECRAHFATVQEQLTALEVGFVLNPRLVRGLDYYTKTAFEIMHGALGAQNVLLGGGRYDGLVEQCGGDPTPGIGFGSGIERALLVLEQTGRTLSLAERRPVFLAAVSDPEQRQAQALALTLRRAGVGVEVDHKGRSLKAQLRAANRLQAAAAVFLREENLAQGFVTLRQMDNGTQEEVALEELVQRLKKPGN
jgi:histidyl-tRNA synthetase